MKRAVCFIKVREDGYVLAISRYRKSGIAADFGFPGGKVEENESLTDAIKREVLEETGLTVTDLVKVYEAEDNSRSLVTTYTGTVEDWTRLESSDEGEAVFVRPNQLCSDECTYKEYNLAVFEAYKHI